MMTAIIPNHPNRYSPHRQRVLVVDDEPNVAMVIQQALKRLPDCEITTVSTGDDAWRLFQNESFDLVITDYNMPGMDGMALARLVRRHSPHTAVIMMTAYSLPQLSAAAAETNIQQVINKPIAISEIRRLALKALQNVENTG